MHVGSGVCNVSQRRCFKGSFVGFDLRFMIASESLKATIIADAYADIVKFAIGEQCILGTEGMTGGAVSFLGINEESEAADLSRGERAFVAAVLKAIEGGVAAQDGSFETRERLFDAS